MKRRGMDKKNRNLEKMLKNQEASVNGSKNKEPQGKDKIIKKCRGKENNNQESSGKDIKKSGKSTKKNGET